MSKKLIKVMDRIVLGFEELGDPVGCGCRVVTSDGNQELDIVVLEESEVEILLEVLVGRLEAAHLKVGASPVEISVGLEEIDVLSARRLAEES